MIIEEYVRLIQDLETEFKGKELFNKDFNRVMSWAEIAENFLTYRDYENESIIDFVINATDRNGNCELIEKGND